MIAGGAFLVAPRSAGNIRTLLTEIAPSQGILLDDEVELVDLFQTQKLQELSKQSRRKRGYLLPEGNSVDIIQSLNADHEDVTLEAACG